MAQSGKDHRRRVIVGHGANAGRTVPDPDAGLVLTAVSPDGLQRTGEGLVLPLQGIGDLPSPAGSNDRCHIFIQADRLTIQFSQHITHPNPGFLGRIAENPVLLHIGESDHDHPFGEHLDAEGVSAGDHHLTVHKLHIHLFDGYAAQNSQGGSSVFRGNGLDLSLDLQGSADGDSLCCRSCRHIEVIGQGRAVIGDYPHDGCHCQTDCPGKDLV